MKFDLSFAGFVLSVVVAASGWFFRWSDKQKFERQQSSLERQQAIHQAEAAAEKAVNEQRDFNHLRNNQIQISQGIATGFDEIERKVTTGFDENERKVDHLRELLIEMKAYLIRNQRSAKEE